MQMKIKYLLLALFLVCSLPIKSNDVLKRGLYFRSFEVDKDKRTSLDLTPEKPLIFHKGFSVEFDLNLRTYIQTFGYVFRIICNDTLNVDFLANITSDVTNFSVVFKNQTVIQYRNSELSETIENTWVKVLFVFDPADNRISLSLNGIKKDATCSLAGLKCFDLYFGGNKHRVFSTTDVTPMTVKDIRIFGEKKNLVRYWELGKHLTDAVYDQCVSDRAAVYNPVWEIDHHVKWTKRENLTFEGLNPQISFDRNNSRFYFANNRKVLIYDMNQRKIDTVEVVEGIPFNIDLTNQIFIDPNRSVLLSYDFENKRLAVFDFLTRSWDNNDNSSIMPRYLHHSRQFIAEDSLLVTFGGYGFHRYNSLFYKCSVVGNTWDMADLSRLIPPRYLGSMGRLDDRILLYFGGFGNESGLQQEFPRNYYDLYTIHIDSLHVKKIWELPNPKEHFTNSNSLVIDKNNEKFYALAYTNKRYASVIKLHEYHLNKPEYRVVGDSIPYFFNDIESYCDLFQTDDGAELYAVTSFVRGNNSDIHIYSMSFPPLSSGEIVQHIPVRSNARLWFISIALMACLAGIFMIYRKRKTEGTVHESVTNKQIPDKDEKPVKYDSLWAEKKPSYIHLLGNFQMVDNHGNEITKNFTPTTTQLFLLFLISTIKNGKGITSAELRKTMWFDKDDDSARNNRNVYVNKLRAILKSFNDIRIVNQNGYWAIQSEKTVFCDYERALVLIQMLQTGERFNKKLLTELVNLALRGTLLPYVQQTEWLEPHQTDYANRLIECLMRYSQYDELKTDRLLLLKIADAILLHDNIDEDAIRLKCYALFQSGRKNKALQAFNKFTADYESLLATKHNLVFDELVKSM